jgi:hypothetical protein
MIDELKYKCCFCGKTMLYETPMFVKLFDTTRGIERVYPICRDCHEAQKRTLEDPIYD